MNLKKKHIIPFLNKVNPIIPLDYFIKKYKNLPFLPFYHAIGDAQNLPHIKHLYSPRTIKQFEGDLDFILKKFHPIDLDELISFSKGKKKFNKPVFHLTFDDGLKEVYEIALPILEKKGIPATIFINSEFVDNKDLFFRYKVSLIIEKLNKEEYKLKNKLLRYNLKDLRKINTIGEKKGINFNSFLTEYQPYMNTKQLNNCIKRGFTLGGHSMDHPYYSNILFEEQKSQTIGSLSYLKENFGLAYKAFAFPFSDDGVDKKFFLDLYQKKEIDISFGTSGIKMDELYFHFQRLGMENKNYPTKEIITNEYAYFNLLKIFGKHIRKH